MRHEHGTHDNRLGNSNQQHPSTPLHHHREQDFQFIGSIMLRVTFTKKKGTEGGKRTAQKDEGPTTGRFTMYEFVMIL
jgi:hypothetical protein